MEGSRLGPYQLLDELGTGGMGKVYRAEVVGAASGLETGCTVALKVIHAHLLETPGFFKRFLREADLGRTIEHENVVRTFDCDALLHKGIQQNFLVMEYVEGQTLRELLQELERVPEELCRHIGREVAKGLAAIHEAGVVHRDLKPENVLITADHVVKIMDLGVARLQAEAIRLSQTGAFVGSLEYAAPEQFRSADGEPDGRADLHALGVVLYELATGQHPYRDEDASRVIGRILNDTPRKAGEVNPQLSPFFEEVVHTLIAKDRDKRFGAAADLAVVLEEGEKSVWWKERAKALRVETKRPLRRIRIPRETALYGRDDDLAKLHALYEKAKAGDGRVLLIEGEAGIGKTRLVDEFVSRLRQEGEDINFVFASYPPGGAATAAGAFSEAYREQFGAEGLEDTLKDYLKPTPILIPAFAAILKGETTPKDTEPLTKDSLQTVFVHATRGLAAERTTIVLIDDLHFAPEDGRALFSSLAMAVPGHRILLLGTMRPGVPEDWIANVTRLGHAEQRSLSRLGPKDLSKLLIDAFRSERLATELGLRIAQKSDGNPFFAFEILRGLREGQFIAQQPDGTWVTTKVIQNIQVPSSVLDLVNARVADLSEEERDLLDVASCCGFKFDPVLVASTLGLGQIPALKGFARVEKKHRLVRSAGANYTFDHHQVQEALYEGLHERLRQPYHTAIAEALEAREDAVDKEPKDLDGALCVTLCDHFLMGARGERALRYLTAAQDHLRARYLHDQAIVLAERALSVPDLLEGALRVEVLLRLVDSQEAFGRPEGKKALIEEALTLARKIEDTTLLARAHVALGNLFKTRSSYEAALAEYEAVVELARGVGDTAQTANALWGTGLVLSNLGRERDANTRLEQSRAIYHELGNRAGEARAIGSIGGTLLNDGRYEDAIRHFEQSLAIARELGDRVGELAVTGNLGIVYALQGRSDKSRAQFERAMAICKATGNRHGEANCAGNLGNVSLRAGQLADARAHYGRALAMHGEVGDRSGEASVLGNVGIALLFMGQRKQAQAHLERAVALAGEVGNRRLESYGLNGLGSVAEAAGNVEEARRCYEQSLAIRRDIGYRSGMAPALEHLGCLLLDQGQSEEAAPLLEEAVALARELGLASTVVVVLCKQASITDGDAKAALEAFTGKHDELSHFELMKARLLLYEATGDRQHLEAAHDLLAFFVEHAPEEYRESMLKNVPLHREIMEAWAEHGEPGE